MNRLSTLYGFISYQNHLAKSLIQLEKDITAYDSVPMIYYLWWDTDIVWALYVNLNWIQLQLQFYIKMVHVNDVCAALLVESWKKVARVEFCIYILSVNWYEPCFQANWTAFKKTLNPQ